MFRRGRGGELFSIKPSKRRSKPSPDGLAQESKDRGANIQAIARVAALSMEAAAAFRGTKLPPGRQEEHVELGRCESVASLSAPDGDRLGSFSSSCLPSAFWAHQVAVGRTGGINCTTMPSEPLRELAVTVREHGPRTFYWVLIERAPAGEWDEIAVSNDYQSSWIEAFDAGIIELYRRVPDEQGGPREGS
ncbi:hypothetical protein QTH97_30815 [Variovorax sp. J22R24]|uniref:hypothetical protein n=1 Tax=Variovorax gracilis TaxID=3053502 RepID=UPI002574DFB9|nr:hypothetical protein [Variovorax sp. J22R24]MDM0109355.1 hypothetical protein [Variovorax sp. J22R24]